MDVDISGDWGDAGLGRSFGDYDCLEPGLEPTAFSPGKKLVERLGGPVPKVRPVSLTLSPLFPFNLCPVAAPCCPYPPFLSMIPSSVADRLIPACFYAVSDTSSSSAALHYLFIIFIHPVR